VVQLRHFIAKVTLVLERVQPDGVKPAIIDAFYQARVCHHCVDCRPRLNRPQKGPLPAESGCTKRAGYQCGPAVERVLFVRMGAIGVALDYFLVETKKLTTSFPRWLARKVPMPPRGCWSSTPQALLERLATVGKRGARAAAGPARFKAGGLRRTDSGLV
jgi:hypothetical protein